MRRIVATDGGYVHGTGPGAIAYIYLILDDAGGEVERRTTAMETPAHVEGNNQAELCAVHHALVAIPADISITLITDSRNVIGWLRDGWAQNNPGVKYWCSEIDRILRHKRLHVVWEHTRGHTNADTLPACLNRECDEMCRRVIREAQDARETKG